MSANGDDESNSDDVDAARDDSDDEDGCVGGG